MQIIIIGAGIVGFGLTEHLSKLKHQITIIEQDKTLCEYINSKLDVFVVNGMGSSPAILQEAGIKSADMIIAVTPNDETNLLACNFAMQNKVKKRIARVKSDIYTDKTSCIDLDKLGITQVIEPERENMQKILQYIELPDVLETANFQSNSIYLRGYQVTNDMPIVNKTLAEIKALAKNSPILFVAIIRSKESLHPTGDQKILAGDKIIAIMPKNSFKEFLFLINRKVTKLKKIIIFGDSLTAIHLAQALKPLSEQVLFVNPHLEHGRIAAALLDGVEILHGDCTDSELLQEINVMYADFFIAVSKDTEDNIMSCLLAKTEGTKQTIAIRNNDRYSKLFRSLGIDQIINPQQITLDAIIEKIQTVSLGTYIKLKTANIEIIRIKVEKNSSIAKRSLRTLDQLFKKSIVIGCIIRNNSAIIPEGNTIIEVDDEAIVFCKKKHIATVKKIFSPSLSEHIKSIIKPNPQDTA